MSIKTIEVKDAVDDIKRALENTQGSPTLSKVLGVMTHLPRVIESAVESGHKALLALAHSAKAYGTMVNESRQAAVESLLKMLDDVTACLDARAKGASSIKNATIDEALIKGGVREPRVTRVDGAPAVQNKSGVERYIGVATFQHEALWPEKKAAALRFIRATGLEFPGHTEKFTEPYKALQAGVPLTSVYATWQAAVRYLNDQVTPPVKATKAERATKQAINLPMAEREALLAALKASIPATQG